LIQLDSQSFENAVMRLSTIQKQIKHPENAIEFLFESFEPKKHSQKVAAIDGSHHGIKGIDFVLLALRAGVHIYQEGKLIKSDIDPVKIEIILNSSHMTMGYDTVYESYYQGLVGELPNQSVDREKVPERIRTLLEWTKVKKMVEELGEGDIVVFDGSLISGAISTNHDFVHTLTEEAKRKKIALVGLSKDSGLMMGVAPLSLLLANAARNQHPGKNWMVSYKDSYFIQFNAERPMVFRMDCILPEGSTPQDLVEKLAAYAYDPACLGYPFPMQHIHDSVRIDRMQMQDCVERLQAEFQKIHAGIVDFKQLFETYHQQLDQISWGR
jgi:hypothetical protein